MTGNVRSDGAGDLTSWSAELVAARVGRGEIRAVEIVQAHLDRIHEVNGELNAMTRVNERALAEAAAVDRGVDNGQRPRLAGVPVTIKDNVDVAGDTTPNGVAMLNVDAASADAPLVKNLRAAGAVVLGRTNTPEFSWRWHTDNPLFGASINPWDECLTPGGSSGGAAAALAAGIGCLAQGNDAGGSVRWPANCTAISALKPTTGRIPSHNVTSFGERPLGVELLATQGPMARSVADTRLMLEVMAEPSWRDPSYVPTPIVQRHRMRAGWCLGAGAEPHPEVVAAVELACGALIEGGWTVEPVAVPDLEASARGWATLINTDFHQTSRATMLELGSPDISAMLDAFDVAGAAADLAGIYTLLAQRAGQLREWQRLLTLDVDVVVLPVAMEPAWPPGDDMSSPRRLEEIFAANTPLVAFNFLGLPAAAQPTSVVDGRPNGVQIVARRFAEGVALDAAATIEEALGLFIPPPFQSTAGP
jgi:amidase